MDLLEKLNGAMKVNASKRGRVEKALHSLQVEWKNLDHADSSTQRLLQDCCTDIQSRQERLNTVQQSVTNSSRVLEEMMKSLEKKLEEVESREKGLGEMHEKISEDLELKMEELGSIEGVLERGVRDFEERKKLIEEVFEKFCLEKREFEGFKGLIEERLEEVKLKEKDIEDREEELSKSLVELDVKMKSVVEKEEEFEVKEKSIHNREIKLDKFMIDCALKMKNVADKEREAELKEKSMKNREVELDRGLVELKVKMKDLVEKERNVGLKEKSLVNREIEFDRGLVEFDVRMKTVEDKERELEMQEKSIGNRKIELDVALVKFDERMKNVSEREKEVELKVKSIQNRESELGMVELHEKMKNVAEMEKEVQLKLKSITKREDELDGILDELDLTKKNVTEREGEVELKEKGIEIREIELDKGLAELDVKMKNLSEKEKEFELKVKNFENCDLELDETLVEVRSLRKNGKKKLKKLQMKKKSIKKREIKLDNALDEFDVKMKNVAKKEKELRLKEKELGLKEKNFENRDIELDGALVEFDLIRKNVEDREKELEMKEKSLENRKIELESKENEVNLKQISSEERCRKLELETEKLEEQIKELELKKKKVSSVDHSIVKPEPWSDDGSYADIRFAVTMDGNNLLLYLINHKRDLESMTDEVYKALGKSMDPAKLVLDAMQGFYAKKEDKEFEEDVVCRSSILLLEQLRRISPRIQSYHRKAALELARKWKEKMKSSMEAIISLQLLAAYKLESFFEPEDFLSLFEVTGQPIQISELFQLLGYMGKISDLIQVMLKEKQHLKAVRYVCAFGLHDKFQPASLLKDFLNNAVEVSKTLREDINSPVNKKDKAISNIVASLEEALVCIRQLKLESEYSPESIEVFIQQLVQQKEDGQVQLLGSNNDADKQQEAEKNCQSAQSVPDPAETCTTQLDYAANGLVLDSKSAMAVILANMDGKHLQLFLNENAEDHELICNNVFDGLNLSKEPAKLVLDAIQGFNRPHLEMGEKHYTSAVIRRSCILLLEQLMKLSPEIKPQVKEDAVILALDWKAKMRTPFQLLGFLHLVNTYGLNSNFDPSGLDKFFEIVSYLQHVPQLRRLIKFSENSPNHTFTSTSNFHSQHKSSSGKKKSKFIQSVNSVKLVLNAMRSCYYSNLNGNRSLKSTVVDSFIILVQNLLTMPQQVHPHVQEEALKFALDWKTRLVDDRNRNPTEVFGLFYLLALLKVASSVDINELVGLMESIYQKKESPDIIRLLGLEHKIPDLIESIIQKGDRLQAIRYIYEFKLVGQFPPVPILKDHISFNKVLAEEIHGNVTSHEPKGNAIGKQLASLEAIVKCIKDYQLEVEYPPESLLAQIQQLKEQPKKNTKRANMPKQFGKKRPAAGSDLGPEAQMRQRNRKRSRTEPLVETSLNVPPPAFPSRS